MTHRTIFVPLLMPKLSDQAALIDILEQLLGIAQHHYCDRAHRYQRRQGKRAVDRHNLNVAPRDHDLRDEPFRYPITAKCTTARYSRAVVFAAPLCLTSPHAPPR